MDEEFYTVEEIAEKLKVTRKAVYDWMRDGRLKYIQAGPRSRRISREAFAEFLRSNTIDGPKPDTQILTPVLA